MNPDRPNFNTVPPSQELSEPTKSEQEVVWGKKRAEVDGITDDVGTGIDEKIKDTVTAFLVHGFDTSQSCEGHTHEEGKHGASFPWVEIYAPEPKGWKDATGEKKIEFEQEWAIENLKQQQKIMDYYAEFY